jgi:hypothetical protein
MNVSEAILKNDCAHFNKMQHVKLVKLYKNKTVKRKTIEYNVII